MRDGVSATLKIHPDCVFVSVVTPRIRACSAPGFVVKTFMCGLICITINSNVAMAGFCPE